MSPIPTILAICVCLMVTTVTNMTYDNDDDDNDKGGRMTVLPSSTWKVLVQGEGHHHQQRQYCQLSSLIIVFPTSILIRELLFQSLSDQLLAAYSDSTPFPFGSVICLDIIMIVMMAMMCNEWTQVIGQEIFQSGVIPSDTDFRVFRDFAGKLFSSLYYAIQSLPLI